MLATLAGSGVLAVAAIALSGWPVAVFGAGLRVVLCAWLLALGLDLLARA